MIVKVQLSLTRISLSGMLTSKTVNSYSIRWQTGRSGEMSRCDFCSETPVFAVYDCPDIDCSRFTNYTIPVISNAEWAACKPCSELIDADRWEELIDRALDLLLDKQPAMKPRRNQLRTLIKETYAEVRHKLRRPN